MPATSPDRNLSLEHGSVDLAGYIDLTLFDKSYVELMDLAKTALANRLPDWVPQEGNTEMLLMESLALEVTEVIYAVNRLPNAIMQILLLLYGVDRDYGAPPTTSVRFSVADESGHDIPAGTRVQLVLGSTREPVVFTTTESLTIPALETSGVAPAVGDRFTSDVNGLAPGTTLEILDAITYVDYAYLAATPIEGRDPETDADWLNRGASRFERLSEALVLPDHFTQAALEDVNVFRAYTLDNFDNDAPTGWVGDDPGHVTVAVYGESDLGLTAPDKVQVLQTLQDKALGNLGVHITDPVVTDIDVNVTVRFPHGYTADVVTDAVLFTLQQYLNPDVWKWSDTVRRNDLIALVSGVDGVAFVEAMNTPAADVALPGAANLVRCGTLNITATEV